MSRLLARRSAAAACAPTHTKTHALACRKRAPHASTSKPPTCRKLVDGDGKGIHVGRGAGGLLKQYLWCHVLQCASDGSFHEPTWCVQEERSGCAGRVVCRQEHSRRQPGTVSQQGVSARPGTGDTACELMVCFQNTHDKQCQRCERTKAPHQHQLQGQHT